MKVGTANRTKQTDSIGEVMENKTVHVNMN